MTKTELTGKAKIPPSLAQCYYALAVCVSEEVAKRDGTDLKEEMRKTCAVLADSAQKAWREVGYGQDA